MRALLAATCLAATCLVAACVPARVPAESTAITGREWRLVELDGAAVRTGGVDGANAARGATPWMRLDADSARVSGHTGCNGFSGPYTLDGASLRFGPIASTMMACADSAIDAQASAFGAALGRTTGYAVTGDTLRLTTDGTATLRFVAR